MKLTTFRSSEPVLSPEKLSVEKKKIADIQIIGGAQYFKTQAREMGGQGDKGTRGQGEEEL